MRARVLLSAGLVMALIGGCGKVYVAPVGRDTVQVKIDNQTGMQLTAHYFAGVEKCTKPEAIGFVETGETKTTRVTTDHPATFVFQRLGMSQGFAGLTVKSCILAMSFRPNFASTYLIALNADDKRCYVNLKQITDGQSSPSRFVGRSYQTPFVKSQGFCTRLTDAQRTSLMAR